MRKIGTKEIFEIMPNNLKDFFSKIKSIEKLQEIRIKAHTPMIYYMDDKEIISSYVPVDNDLKIMVQRISSYSIYAFEEEIRQGYITMKGGHRIGICGKCILENNSVKTIKNIASLNIRICREVIGCAEKILPYVLKEDLVVNTLIISPPKCGKTTIIRDLARIISSGIPKYKMSGKKVCIIDERSEIAACFNGAAQLNVGIRTDVLDGCPKSEGIMMAIRSMSPEVIVCDEIGTFKDMESIIASLSCGVSLITTIHGYDIEDVTKRAIFKQVFDNSAFRRAIVLSNRKGVGTVEYIYDFRENNVLWRNDL